MKRLFAYLVLIFSFTINVNADSIKYSYDKDFVCFQISNGTVFVGSSRSGWATQTDNIENLCSIFVYKDHHQKEYSRITNYWPYLLKTSDVNTLNKHNKIPVHDLFITELKLNKKKFSVIRHQKMSSTQKTQIAKQPEQKLDVSTTAQENTTNYKVTYRKLDTVYKDSDKIYIISDYWGTKADGIAHNHCSSMGKKTFYTEEYRNRAKKHFKKKGYKIKGSVREYLCSVNLIHRARSDSLTPGHNLIEISYGKTNNQTANSSQEVDINFNISEKRQQCEAIGFNPNSEKFADCVLRLVELDMKNQQSNNMMTSQKKSQSDQFMSEALLNIGQQLLQPNSSVNNSRTRNCTVRKSFGKTSTVTCY